MQSVLFRVYEKTLFEQDLAKTLDRLCANYSRLPWVDATPEVKKQLRRLVQLYQAKEYRETPLVDRIDEIVQLLAPMYGERSDEALLRLVLAVLVRKE